MSITASMLYDLVACPHRVAMDLFADPSDRDEISPFIRMLWRKGATCEHDIMGGIGIPVLDLSGFHGGEKGQLTTDAMNRREPIIYSGRSTADDLVGEPDLLRWASHGYVAGDIKSGAGHDRGDQDDASRSWMLISPIRPTAASVRRAAMADRIVGKLFDPGGCLDRCTLMQLENEITALAGRRSS
jgi:hypothetical protein